MDSLKSNEGSLQEDYENHKFISKIRHGQSTFVGHVIKRNKQENLVVNFIGKYKEEDKEINT